MKFVTAALIAIIVLLQYPLWLGKGSWLRVWEVDRQVKLQKDTNQKLVTRNAALDAEVRDLKQGLEAIEERARFELGMVKQDEVFFQIINNDRAVPLALSTELAKVPPAVAVVPPAPVPAKP